MKILKIIFFLFATINFISCGTSHNYSKKPLNKEFYNNKTLYFEFNPESKDYIAFSGMVGTIFDGIEQPNVKETFQLAIKEIADETKTNLIFIENTNQLSNSNNVIINCKVSEINWHFGFSVATLKTEVSYTDSKNNIEIETIGIRKSGGGDEKNNLKKSLKDAIFNFLQKYKY